MKRRLTYISTAVVIIILLGLTCSTLGAMSYVAAQGWPLVSPALTVPEALAPDQAPEADEPDNTERDAEAEYYRAIFDLCIFSANEAKVVREKAVRGCREFVRQAMNGHWFEEPSKDWEWPLLSRSGTSA